jgi:hypothetical protein
MLGVRRSVRADGGPLPQTIEIGMEAILL